MTWKPRDKYDAPRTFVHGRRVRITYCPHVSWAGWASSPKRARELAAEMLKSIRCVDPTCFRNKP